jgi:molybdate-binding protein/predicted nucleic acid-binding protein
MTAPRYLFDTYVCLYLIRHGAGELRDLFAQCAPGEIAISSLTLAALRARAQNSRAPEQNRRALAQFVLPLVVVDFDAEAANWLGRLAAEAETQGRIAGQHEMLAAQALCCDAVLVTNRPELYAEIADLRLRPVHDRGTGEGYHAAPMAASSGSAAAAPPAPRLIRMAGSHDFTLDLLAASLHAKDPTLTLALDSVGSLRGLLALQQGTAQLAGSHLLDEETGDFNRGYIQHLLTPLGIRVVLLGFVEREQGLIVLPGNPKEIRSLADLLREDILFVNRQRGAGTRVLLDHHLARHGLRAEHIQGYAHQEPTHTAVAVAVAHGGADCGLGVLAAARALGLDFVPLFNERFDLVIPVEHYEGPLLQPLLDVLRGPDAGFMKKVAALGGYATGSMGKVLAEL